MRRVLVVLVLASVAVAEPITDFAIFTVGNTSVVGTVTGGLVGAGAAVSIDGNTEGTRSGANTGLQPGSTVDGNAIANVNLVLSTPFQLASSITGNGDAGLSITLSNGSSIGGDATAALNITGGLTLLGTVVGTASYGNILAGVNVGADVGNANLPPAAFTAPSLPATQAGTFLGGTNLVNPATITPGHYGTLTVNSGTTRLDGPGDYYFDGSVMLTGGTFEIDPGAGDIRIFVGNNLGTLDALTVTLINGTGLNVYTEIGNNGSFFSDWYGTIFTAIGTIGVGNPGDTNQTVFGRIWSHDNTVFFGTLTVPTAPPPGGGPGPGPGPIPEPHAVVLLGAALAILLRRR